MLLYRYCYYSELRTSYGNFCYTISQKVYNNKEKENFPSIMRREAVGGGGDREALRVCFHAKLTDLSRASSFHMKLRPMT